MLFNVRCFIECIDTSIGGTEQFPVEYSIRVVRKLDKVSLSCTSPMGPLMHNF